MPDEGITLTHFIVSDDVETTRTGEPSVVALNIRVADIEAVYAE